MPTGYLFENVKDKTVLKTSMLMEDDVIMYPKEIARGVHGLDSSCREWGKIKGFYEHSNVILQVL